MKYRLTIEQFVPNPNYSEELKKYNDDRRYGTGGGYNTSGPPVPENVVKVLGVEVTDVEFAAIKKAALATMA